MFDRSMLLCNGMEDQSTLRVTLDSESPRLVDRMIGKDHVGDFPNHRDVSAERDAVYILQLADDLHRIRCCGRDQTDEQEGTEGQAMKGYALHGIDSFQMDRDLEKLEWRFNSGRISQSQSQSQELSRRAFPFIRNWARRSASAEVDELIERQPEVFSGQPSREQVPNVMEVPGK